MRKGRGRREREREILDEYLPSQEIPPVSFYAPFLSFPTGNARKVVRFFYYYVLHRTVSPPSFCSVARGTTCSHGRRAFPTQIARGRGGAETRTLKNGGEMNAEVINQQVVKLSNCVLVCRWRTFSRSGRSRTIK